MSGWRLAAVLCLLLPGLAAAQAPRGLYNWWDKALVKDLNLSDAQQRQIRGTLRSYRDKMIDQRAAVQKLEGELGDLFNEEHFDVRKAAEVVDRLADARASLTRTLTQLSMQLRSVLTIDQWRELQRRRPLALRRAAPREP